MKKRVLSMFMALALCLTLLPTAAFAEGEDVSISGGVIGGGETGGEGGGIYVAPGSPTEGGGGTYISGEDARTEIWCVRKPDSIGRSYDGTTNGDTIPIDLTFTDGTNEIKLKEGTGFTAKKTFDSADAGWHTVTVEIALIGEAAVKYKLQAGEEKFEIGGNINKAYPKLTVSLSQTTCTAGEKLLPLLSVEGALEDAEVTYYYLASEFKNWVGSSDVEGSEAMPKIDENTAISEPGTYYVYAKSGATKNYEEERSETVELTVNEPAAASVTKADGTDGGTYESLPAALDAARDGDTVKLLANHTTNWSDVEAGDEQMAVVKTRITLDLNGNTVDYLTVGEVVPDEEGGILDSYNGNLTVVDNIQGGSCGKIKNLEFVKGSLAIQGGRIGDNDGGNLTCDGNSGTVTISGGTVCNVTVGDGATVTVTGGTGHAGTWYNDGTLKITDGTFGNVKFLNNGGTIAISGGTFGTITNINGSSSIPLMPLLADNYAFYQGDNAQNSTEKTLTNVTVRPHTHSFENGKCDCGVAAIVVDNNNSCYNTLQAALGAAANNASVTSVTLGQDLTEDVTFSGSAAGSLTLNMNGHKLETEAGVPLTVTGGTLRIEGAGEINQNTASNANAFPAISLTGGKLVITGDLTAQGGYDSSSGRKPAIYATDGELDLQGNVSLNGGLTITGTAKLTNLLTKGTFYAQDPNGNATADNVLAVFVQQEGVASDNYNTVLKLIADGYAIYKADGTVRNAAAFTLKSDTYSIGAHTCNYTQDEAHGIAYCNCGRRHAHRDLSDEKSVLVNGVCPICGYHCPHKNIGDDGVCTDCNAKMVAKVTVGETTTYTADLADALNKAANGTTITLLANTEISAYVNIYDETATGADQMVVTLDLAGHTVTSSYKPIVIGADRNITASYYGTLKIVGTGNITLEYAILNAREKGVLDLTDWTGGSISSVTVTRNGNTNEEGKLIVGKDAGHIGSLAFYNWPSAEITNTKLYGGSYGEITTSGSDTISLAGLLPNGCAFKNEDGSLANATASRLCNVTVSACDHGGKNGFDGTNCPYCNAPAVAETALNNGEGNRLQRRFADLQTALDADRDGGATLKLLADVTGDYTINGTQDTGLDLNGHFIKGTVTVKAAAGSNTTTLSNTQNTTTASIDAVVAHRGANLAGSGYPAVIGELTLADTTKWKDILQQPTRLGFKVTSADGTYKWYAPNDVKGSQLNNVIINSLPITTKTLNLKVDGKNLTGNSPEVERGTTVQLCASCNAKGADVYIYTGEIVGNNVPTYSQKKAEYQKIGTNWYYVVDLDAKTIGTYDIYFTATKDGYSVTSSHKKLTVTKPNLSNAEITFPDGNEAAFNYVTATGVPTFVVTYKGRTLEKDVDFTITSGGSTYDVGRCTLTIKATDDGDYIGSKSAQWNVRPLKVAASVGDIIKTYDGTTDLPANAKITFKSADSYYTGTTLRLAKGTDYEVSNAHYDSADVSQEEKTISFTVKLKNEGYVFEDGTTRKDFALNGAELNDKSFKINKAAAPTNIPTGTLNVINGTQQTYTYDFSKLLPELSEGEYGTISYGNQADISLVSQSGYYYDESIVEFKNGVLTLAQFYAKDGKMTGQIGNVKVKVTTTNYDSFQLKLVLNAVNRITPVPDGTITASKITYGDTLSKSKISGKMKDPTTGAEIEGIFAWQNPDTVLNASTTGRDVEWKFTPTDKAVYTETTGTAFVKVDKAMQSGTVSMAGYTYGQAPSTPILTDRTGDPNAPVTYRYAAAGSDSVQTWDIQNPPALNAGTYRMYASIGVTDNYYGFEAVYCEFVVAKATPTYTAPTGLTAKYGQTLADVTLPNDWSWMNSSESVGGASTAAKKFMAKFTPADTTNYNTVEDIELEVMVNKADGGSLKTVELAQKYTDTSEHTYTPDWSGLPSGQTWRYNSEYSVSTGSNVTLTKQDFAANGSLLTYVVSGGKAGDKIPLTLKASCDNYGDFTITLNISLTEKDDQKPLTITGADGVVYGQTLTLTTTGGSGSGAVTYRIDTAYSTGKATIDPNTGVLTPVKVGSVSVVATKAGDNDYNDVTSAPFVLMIKPATPTGEPKYTKITTSGKTLADAQLTVGTITPAGTISWDAGDTQSVAANTAYNWTFKPTDTVNYNNLTGSITPYTVSHSGGGGGSYNPTYAVVLDKTKNGDITASPKAATKGTIVTLTIDPDKGYELDALKVLDKNGDKVKLTEKNGKYTFTMPAGKVTVKGSFVEEAPEQIFTDVPVDAYCYEAVKWAAEKGITGGVGNGLFAPNQPCTRAQIVTFLWRAAGSPGPKTMSGFSDVPADSYYAKAVAWAVENGITGGTGDGKFSPDATCTRAQAVTFLYRASGAPAVSGNAAFSDVATNAYYAAAVKWAEKNGITGGIGGGLFGSDNNCTRAQIVTFLYRNYQSK